MKELFDSVDEARARAMGDHFRFIRDMRIRLGYGNYWWSGRPLATYIYKDGDKFYSTEITYADLEDGGYHINSSSGVWSGTSAMLDEEDLEGVAAMVVTIMGGERHAEVGYRAYFQMWAEDLEIPVFVRLANERYPWYETYWEHTATGCREVNHRKGTTTPCAKP